VPYEGVSRMTSSMKRKHRDRVVRRVSTNGDRTNGTEYLLGLLCLRFAIDFALYRASAC